MIFYFVVMYALRCIGPRHCSAQQLSELDYLGKVIKEGMRLWPVVADGSTREITVDIPYKKYVLPKGSTVAINNFLMFRTNIQNPDEFIPERWEEDGEDIEQLKELFIPFSSGPRNCIGQSLALLELKLVIATLFYSYDFEIIGDFYEYNLLTLRPQDASLRVHHRADNN
jgi:cytochrome P450